MKVKPLADRVLVRLTERRKTTKGGIVIPDTAKEKPQEGKVLAIGPGKINNNGKRVPMEVKEGNHIIIDKFAGTEIKIEGEEYIIIRETDVLAILEK